MSEPPISPEARQWIVDQIVAGHPPDAVLRAMQASGWSEDVAYAGVETVLRDHLADRAREIAAQPAFRVPEPPDEAEGRASFRAADREVRVLASLRLPRLVVFGGLLADEECDELIALAGSKLARSETVQTATGSSEVNDARTSHGMFFERGEHPVCARLEARVAALLNWPVENGEGLQVLRYRPGAEYKPHYDYFDPAQPGTPAILRRGGQRVASLVCYLGSPVRGGATVFPDAQLEVAPVKGNAVFFSYDRPHPMTRSLHGGAPVLEGEKWVATKWLRQARFD